MPDMADVAPEEWFTNWAEENIDPAYVEGKASMLDKAEACALEASKPGF